MRIEISEMQKRVVARFCNNISLGFGPAVKAGQPIGLPWIGEGSCMFFGHKPVALEVRIRKGLCVGCLNCVATCKNNNFVVQDNGKPDLVISVNCTGCGKCMDGCLTKAISVMSMDLGTMRPVSNKIGLNP